MKKLIYILAAVLIAQIGFSYSAKAQQKMVWGDTLTQDQKDSVARDKNYVKNIEKIEKFKEAKRLKEELKAKKIADKEAKKFKFVKDPTAHTEISKLQSEVRQGFQGTSNNILQVKSQFEKQQIENKKFIDSLNYLLAQYKKLVSDSSGRGLGVVNNSQQVSGSQGLVGPQGPQGLQGLPGRPAENRIVAITLPGPNTSSTTILNASNEQIVQAFADKFKTDSVFASQIAKVVNGEAGKNGLSSNGSNGKNSNSAEAGKNGSPTVWQVLDSLKKEGYIGSSRSKESLAYTDSVIAFKVSKILNNGSNGKDGVNGKDFTDKQLNQLIQALKHDSVFASQIAKVVNGEAGKNGLSSNGSNSLVGGVGNDGQSLTPGQLNQLKDFLVKEGITGSQGPRGSQGERGIQGPAGERGPQGPAGEVDLVLVKKMIDDYLDGKNYITAEDVQKSINKYFDQNDASASVNTSKPNTLKYKNGVDGKNGYDVVEKDDEENQAGAKRDPSASKKIPSNSDSNSGLAQNNLPKLKNNNGNSNGSPRRIIIRIIHDDE